MGGWLSVNSPERGDGLFNFNHLKMKHTNLIAVSVMALAALLSGCHKSEKAQPVAPVIMSAWPVSGTGNTIVKIHGENFSTVPSANVIKFNGQEAVVLEATASDIQVVSPKDGTTGPITLAVQNTEVTGPVYTYVQPAAEYVVSTVAGNGTTGLVNGPAASAEFSNPEGVLLDGSGNFIITDRSNHCIRMLSGGSVTTFAGTGKKGFKNGPAAEAMFNSPYRPAIDQQGNIYIADRDNNMIREITPGGTVSTVAGSGKAGYEDGPGATAEFHQPIDVAVDAQHNIYVADNLNHSIRKIAPDGTVSTLAGNGSAGFADGQGSAARFSSPSGVAVDKDGNILVADRKNQRIRKITPDGTVSTVAGSGTAGMDDGTATSASFHDPYGVCVGPDGGIYVADLVNNKIRKIAMDGTVSTIAGSGAGFADGAAVTAKFKNPTDICVDSAGNIFVADMSNGRIRKISRK